MTKAFLLEIKCEFLSLLRMPRYSVATIAFPVMFYLFFGVVLRQGGIYGISASAFVLCTMAVFGVMIASTFAPGVGIASERSLGWMDVKRASPMPPAAGVVARLASTLLFSAITVGTLFVLGATAGGVRMRAAQWAELGVALVAGAVPFCALGFFLGYVGTANSAAAMVNLVTMPMAFFSGLWVPLDALPKSLQGFAHALPAYHLAQIGTAICGATGRGGIVSHIASLASLTLVFAGAAWFAWRRDEGRVHVG
jgi:ABC-2 type transport system permease protein